MIKIRWSLQIRIFVDFSRLFLLTSFAGILNTASVTYSKHPENQESLENAVPSMPEITSLKSTSSKT